MTTPADLTVPASPAQLKVSPAFDSEICQALAEAISQCWSTLPQEVQRNLFEAAVAAHGKALRPRLAIFLHGKHTRTLESLQTRAIPEPDSLGG